MIDPKIEKVNTQIANTKAKISEYQAKLRALERQKTDLENERIIALVRSERISDAELATLMQSFRKEESATVPKISEQEDTENEEI